jgi:hypothetical protein
MSVINYAAERQLLVVARGHPYAKDAFSTVFDSLEDYCWSLVEQPAAARFFHPDSCNDYAAMLCYDMPGVDFTAPDDPPSLRSASEGFKRNFLAMLDCGMGMVFMHHSLAAWPAWDEYAEIVGGRFHYRPATLRGQAWPDSGYRHDITHIVRLLEPHPVTAGLPNSFEMTDELYLCPVFSDSVTPLLASNYAFNDDNFYSAKRAVEGRMYSRQNWSHPPGSSLVGWVKHYRNSPIVYLQGGDNELAMDNPQFRMLVHNAIRWVSSPAAHRWAKAAHLTIQS